MMVIDALLHFPDLDYLRLFVVSIVLRVFTFCICVYEWDGSVYIIKLCDYRMSFYIFVSFIIL